MDGAKAVKRHNAQYDVFNRLHSIAADQAFVERVSKEWFEGRFEVVRKASVLQVEWN
jgi:tRNA A64-2'-O-ribosylphosphate transferase